MSDQVTTCQVCGRAIKASSGRIAHHGYQRPHQQGWQSASCFGARWRPYEIACDALPPAIAAIEHDLASSRDNLQTLLNQPPETLTYRLLDSWGIDRVEPITLTRPDGFDPGNMGYVHPRSYQSEFASRRSQAEQRIRWCEDALATLRKRLSDWTPPHAGPRHRARRRVALT